MQFTTKFLISLISIVSLGTTPATEAQVYSALSNQVKKSFLRRHPVIASGIGVFSAVILYAGIATYRKRNGETILQVFQRDLRDFKNLFTASRRVPVISGTPATDEHAKTETAKPQTPQKTADQQADELLKQLKSEDADAILLAEARQLVTNPALSSRKAAELQDALKKIEPAAAVSTTPAPAQETADQQVNEPQKATSAVNANEAFANLEAFMNTEEAANKAAATNAVENFEKAFSTKISKEQLDQIQDWKTIIATL